jgi:hypothetical protein
MFSTAKAKAAATTTNAIKIIAVSSPVSAFLLRLASFILNGIFLIATIHVESYYLSVFSHITERLFTKSRSLLLQFAVLQKMHSLSP